MKRNVIVGVSVVVVLVVAVIVAVALYLKYRTPAAAAPTSSIWSTYGPANPPTPTMNWDDTSSTWSGTFTIVQGTSTYPLYVAGNITTPIAQYNSTTWLPNVAVPAAGASIQSTSGSGIGFLLPASFSTITIDGNQAGAGNTGMILSIL